MFVQGGDIKVPFLNECLESLSNKEEAIVARDYEGNGREIPADSVILAMGLKSRSEVVPAVRRFWSC